MKRRQKNIALISTLVVIIIAIISSLFPTTNRMLEKCADMRYQSFYGKGKYVKEFINKSLQKKLLAEHSGGQWYNQYFGYCENDLKRQPRKFKVKYK